MAGTARLGTLMFAAAAGLAAQTPSEDRIATPQEIKSAIEPQDLALLRVLSWPHRKFTASMERGMVAFEQKKVLEHYQKSMEDLRRHGVTPKFGGMGEGSGFGGGVVYEYKPAEKFTLRNTTLLTFSNYQELDFSTVNSMPASEFFLEASYQWRPRENYYGQGHDTLQDWHTTFALRQAWTGLRYEFSPKKRIGLGVLNRWEWITATEGMNQLFPPITSFFPNLPGYHSETRLNTTGAYLDLDGIRNEYELGGAAHFGASYQQSFTGGDVRYFSLEMQLEGRTRIKTRNSVLVGQANFQLNRERGGSDPIPFYLQPRIGGANTLRGYPLDRFYGRNLAVLTLEYRIRVHPNLEFYPLFDEGQIWSQTSDLDWLQWHRNYGFGFRLRTAAATFMRLEFGWGGEGTQFHLVMGDRAQPPLLGPVRSGAYKR